MIVSGATENYPGTSDRVVLVTGNYDAVALAQTLIWKMIAQNTQAGSDRSSDWSPEIAFKSLDSHDEVEVSAKITIPSAVGGLILGKGGETIKSIASDTGAKIVMTRYCLNAPITLH